MVFIAPMDQLAEVRAAAAPVDQMAEGRPTGVALGAAAGRAAELERAERLKCPRCESTDTKFCYYNNYNLQQPRHFCKACRRYWTRGGALRNVPVGGGTRGKLTAGATGRRKRAANHTQSQQAASSSAPVSAPVPLSASAPLPLLQPPPQPYELTVMRTLAAMDPDRRLLDLGGSFSSLIGPSSLALPNGYLPAGFLFGGGGAALPPAPAMPQPPVAQQGMPENIWTMGWPDLSI